MLRHPVRGCAAAPSGNQASLNDTALIYSASYPYRLDSVDGKAVRYGGSGNVREYRNSKLTYSAADKVLTIDSWNAGKKDSTSYSYGPNGDRYRKAVSRYVDGQLENSSTFYISSVYERHQRAAGAGKSALTEEKYFIGDVIITKRSNQAHSVFYQLKDEQGSTLMLTDDKGKEVNRYYYTPFGEQRDVSLSPLPSSMLQPSRYGYTGHEHVAGLDIINMGGRIYSHSLRRFLQADPLVAHPMYSQSYNPYQYVYNNPLVNTDPSGYAAWFAVPIAYAGIQYAIRLAVVTTAKQAAKKTIDHIPGMIAAGGVYVVGKEMASPDNAIGSTTTKNRSGEVGVANTSSNAQSSISNGVYGGRSVEGPRSGSYEHIPGEVAPLGNVYSKSPNYISWLADGAQEGGKDGGVASQLETENAVYADISTHSDRADHPALQRELDNAKREVKVKVWHGACAEIGCINAALHDGVNLKGATITSIKIREKGRSAHGTNIGPCPTCAYVMDKFGIKTKTFDGD